MTYCKPGDLAVVVKAHNVCNIGTIVHVIGLNPDQSSMCAPEGDVIWQAKASHPMAYDTSGVITRRRLGPVPDSQLRPIRGAPQAKKAQKSKDLVTT
jgi:hypothetical protein